MVEQPLVSAIIVVRNGDAFLGEAMDSVIAQTLPDWELIIVDDGSTDETPRIIDRYARAHPALIRGVTHPNRRNLGIAASRNRGIAEANGRYVAFLDADDVWLPEKLAEQVEILDADPDLGLVYGRTLIWHSWARAPVRADYYCDLGVPPDARYEPPVLFELLLENRAQTPTTCNVMIRASVFERLGGFDPRMRGMFEDLSFLGKALATTPAYVSGRTWARYRQHPESCTAVSAATGGDAPARLRALHHLGAALAPHAPSARARSALRAARRDAATALGRIWYRNLRLRVRQSLGPPR
jgi:hypothetical protein